MLLSGRVVIGRLGELATRAVMTEHESSTTVVGGGCEEVRIGVEEGSSEEVRRVAYRAASCEQAHRKATSSAQSHRQKSQWSQGGPFRAAPSDMFAPRSGPQIQSDTVLYCLSGKTVSDFAGPALLDLPAISALLALLPWRFNAVEAQIPSKSATTLVLTQLLRYYNTAQSTRTGPCWH